MGKNRISLVVLFCVFWGIITLLWFYNIFKYPINDSSLVINTDEFEITTYNSTKTTINIKQDIIEEEYQYWTPFPWISEDIINSTKPTSNDKDITKNIQDNHNCDYKGKVFVIGMFKTGTKSVQQALDLFGYPCYVYDDNNIRMPSCSANNVWYLYDPIFPYFVGVDDISWVLYDEYLKYIKNVTLQASSFSYAPWNFMYPILDKWYPNSKFILTIRNNTFDAVNSQMKMILREDNNVNLGYKQITNINKDVKSYLMTIQQIIMLDARRYDIHLQNVNKYFKHKKHQLLTLNLWKYSNSNKIWNDISTFLGCKSIPNITFPHENKAPKIQPKIILPNDTNLNWHRYKFKRKYHRFWEYIHQHSTNANNDEFLQGLTKFYTPKSANKKKFKLRSKKIP